MRDATIAIHAGYATDPATNSVAVPIYQTVSYEFDSESLARHPAPPTQRQLTANKLACAGVKPDMIRLSVGIEHCANIIADLAQALDVAGTTGVATRHTAHGSRLPMAASGH